MVLTEQNRHQTDKLECKLALSLGQQTGHFIRDKVRLAEQVNEHHGPKLAVGLHVNGF